MKLRFPRLRPLDYLIAVLATGLIIASSVAAYSSGSGSSHVRVQTANGEFLYELDSDTTVGFDGPIGTTHVEIENGAARVASSPCREQICVNSGAHDSAGDWTACLPNRIFLEVTGPNESEIDVLSY